MSSSVDSSSEQLEEDEEDVDRHSPSLKMTASLSTL